MTDAMMESCLFDLDSRPSQGGLRDAFADVMRRRYRGDVNVQGRLMRDFDLSVDQAKGILAEKTSIATMDGLLQHRNGGWRLGLAVLSAVIGSRLADYFTSERERLNHEAEERQRRAARLAEAESWLRTDDTGVGDRPPGHRSGVADRAPCGAAGLAS